MRDGFIRKIFFYLSRRLNLDLLKQLKQNF